MNETQPTQSPVRTTEVIFLLITGLFLFFLTSWQILGTLLLLMSIVGVGTICQHHSGLREKVRQSPIWLKATLALCIGLPALFIFYFFGAAALGLAIATFLPILLLGIPLAILILLLALLSKR